MDQLEARKRAAEEAAWQRQRDFAARCPRAGEIKWEMAQKRLADRPGGAGGAGTPKSAMTQLRDRDLALQEEYKSLLGKEGLTPQDLEPRYRLPPAAGTPGFVDGRMCQCLKQLQRSLAYQALSADLPLEKSTFDTFSLEFYQDDPRACRQMEAVLKLCQRYAERLRPNSPSLLFKGKTAWARPTCPWPSPTRPLRRAWGWCTARPRALPWPWRRSASTGPTPTAPGTPTPS